MDDVQEPHWKKNADDVVSVFHVLYFMSITHL